MTSKSFAIAIVLLIAAAPAAAHGPGHEAHGFVAGLLHPLTGIDHVLVMLTVGLWAALASPRLAWSVPAGFLVGMAAGGVVGMFAPALPGLALLLTLSVVTAGLLAAFAVRTPVLPALGIAALLGALHGVAHGSGMLQDPQTLAYGLGLLLATAALHGVGVALGLAARRSKQIPLARCAGALVVAAGVVLLATA